MERDRNTAFHKTAVAVPQAECLDNRVGEATALEVRVAVIQILQLEIKPRIHDHRQLFFCLCFQLWHKDRFWWRGLAFPAPEIPIVEQDGDLAEILWIIRVHS